MTLGYGRRRFLKNLVSLALATPVLSGVSGGEAFSLVEGDTGAPFSDLERVFLDPPDGAWPWVYWYVSDGNLTREGITADFEAMHRVGIRGVIWMEVDQFVPKGEVRFLSPKWREMMRHMMSEASRLGISVNANNDAAWSGSGGPWITPELSMQMVVWSETAAEGPRTFSDKLPQPKTIEDYYEDIAVLAFPTPAGETVRMADCSPKLTYGLDRKNFDFAKLIDGNPGSVATIPLPEAGNGQFLNTEFQYLGIEFPEPFTAQSLTVALDPWRTSLDGSIQVSEDGQNYRILRSITMRSPVSSVNFEKVTARYFQIELRPPGDWIYGSFGEFADGIPLGEVELHTDFRIEDIPGKAAYNNFRDIEPSDEPRLTREMAVRREQVVNLSSKMNNEGRFSWDVPAGKWTILRIGHTSTGRMNEPSPKEGRGLECDKLNKKVLEVQFDGLLRKLLQDQASIGAKAITMTHIDSWECGSQNWTPGLRDEFQKRYGYDLLPYLPILTARAVESREVSERFLWDLRRLIGDLLLENYAGHMREIANQHGLKLSIEAYGGAPLEEVAYGGCADVPQSEFWAGQSPKTFNKEMASSGHVYGLPVIRAESFTAAPDNSRWQNHPYRLKPLGDWAFCQGINQFVLHTYSAQPWLNRVPGMTMGPWGSHFERTNTWFEQSKAWLSYLARCQSLLQKGLFVADIACLGSENVPNSFPDLESMDPTIPPGYDFDDVPPKALLDQATVREGRLVLKSGMSYRVLVLTPGRTITPTLLAKIKELVVAGATVVGPRPIESPSLADYPRCDGEVEQLAAELWGDCDGVSITEHHCGKGKVVWGMPLAEVLTQSGTAPDFACVPLKVGADIRYIHRIANGDHIYFVASSVPERRRCLCAFRVTGRRPEIWWPDSSRMEPVTVYDELEDHTQIPLSLDPCGSAFVIFRATHQTLPNRVISIRHDGVEISGLAPKPAPDIQLLGGSCIVQGECTGAEAYHLEVAQSGTYILKQATGQLLKVDVSPIPPPIELRGPWELEFPPGWGAPERVTLETLISWTEHSDLGVKYFSGTATYRSQFKVFSQNTANEYRLYLDLGRVSVIAEVMLNGRDLGILWKPPFSVEITNLVRAGANDLEVRVVNLWPNRLIGDEHLPDDCEWETPGAPHPFWGKVLREYPRWLIENQPRPSGRVTFTTWKHWTKEDPLLESGLLGPVRIFSRARVTIDSQTQDLCN